MTQLSSTDIARFRNLRNEAVPGQIGYWQIYQTLADLLVNQYGVSATDPSVLWLRGATQANKGEGAFSALIREYTETQYRLRYGTPIPQGKMQEASNAVAKAVLADILGDNDRDDSPSRWPTGKVPTIDRIAEADAQAVGQVLFSSNNADTAAPPRNSAWSGSLLFGLLRSDQTNRLMSTGLDNRQIDTLNDWRDVFYAYRAFDAGLAAARAEYLNNLASSQSGSHEQRAKAATILATDSVVMGTTLFGYLAAGPGTAERRIGNALAATFSGTANPTLLAAFQRMDALGAERVLDMLMGAVQGRMLLGTTSSANFAPTANTFFSNLTPAQLQAVSARLLPVIAADIVALAKQNTPEGASARAALVAGSFIATSVSNQVAGSEALQLFDPFTGQGSLTEKWLNDRSLFVTALGTGQPDVAGQVWRSSRLPSDRLLEFRYTDAAGVERIMLAENTSRPGGSRTTVPTQLIAFGGQGNDALNGQDGILEDRLYGGAGNDQLDGKAGADYLEGQAGDDTLNGGTGDQANDILIGGKDFDTYVFNGRFGRDVVTDADGQGRLVVDGFDLSGVTWKKQGNNTWESAGGNFLIRKADGVGPVGADGNRTDTLTITRKGANALTEAILVNGYRQGSTPYLGLNLGTTDEQPGVPAAAANGLYTVRYGGVISGDYSIDSTGLDGSTSTMGRFMFRQPQSDAPPALPPLPVFDPDTGSKLGDITRQWTTEARADAIFNGHWDDQLNDPADPTWATGRNYLHAQRLEGGGGDDVLVGGFHLGFEPNPEGVIIERAQGALDETIVGGTGDDVIFGVAGKDKLIGGAGADVILASYAPEEQPPGFNATPLFGVGARRGFLWMAPVTQFDDGSYFVNTAPFEINIPRLTVRGTPIPYLSGLRVAEAGFTDSTARTPRGSIEAFIAGKDVDGDDIDAGDGNDIVVASRGDDSISLGTGNDMVYARAGNDLIFGGDGDDQIAADDLDLPPEGTNGVVAAHDAHGVDVVDAGDGNDYVVGGGEGDILYGSAGNDIIYGDWVNSSASYLARGGDDDIDGGDGDDELWGGGGADVLLGGEGDDKLFGQTGNDRLDGGSGRNELDGGDGDDTLDLGVGGTGLAIGGAGNDTLIVRARSQGGELGETQLYGGEGQDTYVIAAGAGDVLVVDDDTPPLPPAQGEPTSQPANTMMIEGATAAQVRARFNQTTLELSASGTTVRLSGYTRNGTASSAWTIALGDGTSLSREHVTALALAGTDGEDVIWGTSEADSINAGAGNDKVYGLLGDDVLSGGEGNDELVAGDGNDTATGDAGNDLLDGGAGNDLLQGGDGNDRLVAGGGLDRLEGGAGDDTFVVDVSTMQAGTSILAGSGNDTVVLESPAALQRLRVNLNNDGSLQLSWRYWSDSHWRWETGSLAIEDGVSALNRLSVQANGVTRTLASLIPPQVATPQLGNATSNATFVQGYHSAVRAQVDSLAQAGLLDTSMASEDLGTSRWRVVASNDATVDATRRLETVLVGQEPVFQSYFLGWFDSYGRRTENINVAFLERYSLSASSMQQIYASRGIAFESSVSLSFALQQGWNIPVQAPAGTTLESLALGGWFVHYGTRMGFEARYQTVQSGFRDVFRDVHTPLAFDVSLGDAVNNATVGFGTLTGGDGDDVLSVVPNPFARNPLGDWWERDLPWNNLLFIQQSIWMHSGRGLVRERLDKVEALLTGPDYSSFIDGGAGDDRIEGSVFRDVLTGGTGRDSLDGGMGSDRYLVVDAGEGTSVRIRDSGATPVISYQGWDQPSMRSLILAYGGSAPTSVFGADLDIVEFGPGVAPGDLDYVLDDAYAPTTLQVLRDGRVLAEIELANAGATGIEELVFQDGSVLSMTSALTQAVNTAQFGTPDGGTLVGTPYNDAFEGDAGSDVLEGGEGNDAYVFRRGWGHDQIIELAQADVANRVIFKGNLLPWEFSTTRDGADVLLTAGSDSIRFVGYGATQTPPEFILAFDTGLSVSLDDLLANVPLTTTTFESGAYGSIDLFAWARMATGTHASQIEVTLPNGDPLPEWLAVQTDTYWKTTRLYGVAPAGSSGDVLLRVVTTSDAGYVVESPFTLRIVNENQAPEVAQPLGDTFARATQEFAFSVANGFRDVDAKQPLTYGAMLEAGGWLEWLSFDGQTGTLSGTPPADALGEYVISVYAYDDLEEWASQTFRLIVSPNNQAPQLVAAPLNQVTLEDASFTYSIAPAFGDSDVGDALTYSASLANGDPLPSWLSFNAATGTFIGTPLNEHVGSLNLRVTATDQGGLSASADFGLTVTNVNDVPTVVVAPADQAGFWHQPFSFVLPADAFADVDVGDVLTTSLRLDDGTPAGAPLPTWLSFNSATRIVSGTAPWTAPTELRLRYSATDLAGAGASSVFALNLSGTPTLVGTSGNDSLNGTNAVTTGANQTPGRDYIVGGAGNDTLNGRTGADRMEGGTGNDTYHVDNTGDAVVERADEGTDRVVATIDYALGANVEDLQLSGTANLNGTGNELNNLLLGNAGANTLTGLAGDDRLVGGAGADTLIGGDGNDLYEVDNAADQVVELSGQGLDTVEASVTYNLPTYVENLLLIGTGTAAQPINATGNAGANYLQGNDAANTLMGLGGDDTLLGGKGADILMGGDGDDTYLFEDGLDTVVETADGGRDAIVSSLSFVMPEYVEDGLLAGSAASVTGNALNNVLTGNASNNTLDGGAGQDILIGGRGNDVYIVDHQADTVVENLNEGTDEVRSSVTYALGDHVEHLTLTGNAVISGRGNDLANRLTGNARGNTLYGEAGNDTLDGGAGADILIGGLGNDIYVVDDADDAVVEALNEGADTVNASISHALAANVENLVLTGSANINGVGNNLNNRITGNAGNNVLFGGLGNDTYVFNQGFGQDVIVNFDAGKPSGDTIQFGAGINAADVQVIRLGDDLMLQHGSDTVTAYKFFENSGRGNHGLERVRFADGTSWNYTAVLSRAQSQTGASATDGVDINTKQGNPAALTSPSQPNRLAEATGNEAPNAQNPAPQSVAEAISQARARWEQGLRNLKDFTDEQASRARAIEVEQRGLPLLWNLQDALLNARLSDAGRFANDISIDSRVNRDLTSVTTLLGSTKGVSTRLDQVQRIEDVAAFDVAGLR